MYLDEEINNRLPDDFLKSLEGGTYELYGADNTSFCIGVNGARMVLEAVENPSDGYRSYFGCFRSSEVGKIFFGGPIARVKLSEGGRSRKIRCFCNGNDPYNPLLEDRPCKYHTEEQQRNFSGWVLKDVDSGHEWLTVGTDYGEDYYPCFVFYYQPDPSKKIESSHD